jgi:hypothetical protein
MSGRLPEKGAEDAACCAVDAPTQIVTDVDFPPVFNARMALPGEDAFIIAQAAARAGELGAADLLWSFDGEWLKLAIVLEPDISANKARRAGDIMLLAVADSLASLLPPQVTVGVSGETLVINGATAGFVRLAMMDTRSEDDIPQWLATGVDVRLRAPEQIEPGEDMGNTALSEEGGGGLTAGAAASAIARHFLTWLDTWVHDGPQPLESALQAYARAHD